MIEQETIDPEYIENKKEFVKIIDDNKIKIILDGNEIKFIIMIGISYYKYIKEYKYEEIKKELDINEKIEKIYEYLTKSEYRIIKEEKKMIINGNKEIKLYESELKDNEMIKVVKRLKILINQIKKKIKRQKYQKMNVKN